MPGNPINKRKTVLDEKTIFHVVQKVINEEYGIRGKTNLKPDFYKNGKLFIQSESSVWKNELWINRTEIIFKLNKYLGSEEIKEIKFK